MTEPEGAEEGIRGRLSARGEEAVNEVVQTILDNPLLGQALQVALGARDAATQASAKTMKGLNVANQAEVERLGRRLRSLSDRLEEVEDRLDQIDRQRRSPGSAEPWT